MFKALYSHVNNIIDKYLQINKTCMCVCMGVCMYVHVCSVYVYTGRLAYK